MPSTHRLALKKLLETIEKRIGEDEARLINAAGDEEQSTILEHIVDLHLKKKEIMDMLTSDDE